MEARGFRLDGMKDEKLTSTTNKDNDAGGGGDGNKRKEPSDALQKQIANSISQRNRQGASILNQTQNDSSLGTNINTLEPGTPPIGASFEYLDHPADIILHSWGADISNALSNLTLCMFGYITSLDSISINNTQSIEHGLDIVGEGHDLHSLIYSYLDEWLFDFHDTGFIPKLVDISELQRSNTTWRIVSSGKGEVMDINRHPQGTEVKAITYSGMKVEETEDRCDIYVVVDI